MKNILLFLLLLSGFNSLAQLPNFTITATATPQTCLGNGALAFSVSGSNPSAVMAYEVFLLPNATTPVVTVNNPYAPNLVAGSYLVVATQTLGSVSNTATTTITIPNQVVPLQYTLTTTMGGCGENGTITANVISGTAVSYEITSGPVTKPQQTSNVFTGLPAGLYQVRVYNDCGDAVVVAVQLVNTVASIQIQPAVALGTIGCTSVGVMTQYWPIGAGSIVFPLNFQYTVYPPGGGAPQIVTQTVNSGSNGAGVLEVVLPFYAQQYYYNLVITDNCGNQFTSNFNYINKPLMWELGGNYDPCEIEQLYAYSLENFTFPVTASFISAPAGFNPVNYNSSHPVFNDGENILYGGQGNQIPAGTYVLRLTDACGRSSQKAITFNPFNEGITLEAIPGNCGFGGMRLCMVGKEAIVKEFTAGPVEFSSAYPVDVMGELQENGDIDLTNLVPGNYTLHVIDECGFEHNLNFIIHGSPAATPLTTLRPACNPGEGAIVIEGTEPFTSIIIQSAPASFTQPLPYDASAGIAANGNFYMGPLPEGSYTFIVTNSCGEFTLVRYVPGEVIASYNFQVTPHCGSFDLLLEYFGNAWQGGFWLQEYNESTGTWGHPLTGNAYQEGTLPQSFNSVAVLNGLPTINLAFIGHFRVLKVTYTYINGHPGMVPCINVVEEFDFDGGSEITEAYSFPCDDGTAEVMLIAAGIPPFNYGISTKDGQPFVVNNGSSPHFLDLEAGVYNFQVTDDCGNIRNIVFDINTLEPLEVNPEGFCPGHNSLLELPNFDFLVYEWWKESEPQAILSTGNTLQFPAFDPDADSGTYMVHITSINPGSCIDLLLSHAVVPAPLPNAGEDMNVAVCNNTGVVALDDYLTDGHHAGGVWEVVSGAATLNGNELNVSNLEAGIYQFKYFVTKCDNTDEAILTVTLSEAPSNPLATVDSIICEGSAIRFYVADIPGAEYLWSGPNGFVSSEQNPVINTATQQNSGAYTVIARINDCDSLPVEFFVTVDAVPAFAVGCVNDEYMLFVTNADALEGYSISWTGPGNFSYDGAEAVITGFEKGDYVATATKPNGCTVEEAFNVISTYCEIPRGISPNGDGSNDYFDLTGFEVEELMIFNRLGIEVFRQKNYKKEWMGQSSKGTLPAGTYYYAAKLAGGETKTGWVYLQI